MGVVDYLRDTKGELKHVNWPTKKQSIAFTALVIVIAIGTGFFLGILDFFFTKFVKLWI